MERIGCASHSARLQSGDVQPHGLGSAIFAKDRLGKLWAYARYHIREERTAMRYGVAIAPDDLNGICEKVPGLSTAFSHLQ